MTTSTHQFTTKLVEKWKSAGLLDGLREKKPTPQPDPSSFTITLTHTAGPFIAAIIVYDGCTNYEGKKVMVFEATREQLGAQKMIDPHFCEENHLSPIARFEPTERGWRYACEFTNALFNGL